MKLVSWNVNGIRACVGKGFLDYFYQIDADVFCIQETKLQEGQISLELKDHSQYWNYAVKKVIPVQQFFQRKSHFLSNTGLEQLNMIPKAGQLPWNLRSFISLIFTHQTLKETSPD